VGRDVGRYAVTESAAFYGRIDRITLAAPAFASFMSMAALCDRMERDRIAGRRERS
jgi:hypothetical protein